MKPVFLIFLLLVLFSNLSLFGQEKSEPVSLEYGFDLGASILIFAHEDFISNFDDAAYSPDTYNGLIWEFL